MRNLNKAFSFIFMLSVSFLWACDNDDDENTENPFAIKGHWQMQSNQNDVDLLIFADSTFHVDVLATDSVEVEGRLELTNSEITFINVQGTDEVSSDPTPGIYEYSIEADTLLTFSEIDDPLERRSGFLSNNWIRRPEAK
ncbi:MAG: hypothetical protein ACQESX_02965 [Bacteroidota bacterium]